MDIGRPVAHANMHRHVPTLLLQECSDATGLLQGQSIERRKAPQMGIVCRHLRQTCLRPRALADDGLDEADGFAAGTGRETPTALWGWAAKPDKQYAVKVGGDMGARGGIYNGGGQ